ncbi:MAG: hypothetical protein K2P84_09875 [Undibacterium sp.]|nr:hypothetical protein [Undibacterium sp.]
MRKFPPYTGTVPPNTLMFAGVGMVGVFSLMLSGALNRTVVALFERGDLDLLLSSPIASMSIFKVRLAGICVGVVFMAWLLLSPIAHVGLFLGQPHWLGIYPTIVSCAVIASSIGMLCTLGLVKLIGVRKTRIVAQILGALVGASIFIVSQTFSQSTPAFKTQIMQTITPWFQSGASLGPESYVWIPAKALFGAPLEVLIFSAFAAMFFWLTARTTHQFFVRGVQQSGAVARATVLTSAESLKGLRFRSGLLPNVLRKEWRLILRDPHLISQVLLQLLYMLPLFFVILKGKSLLYGVTAGLTFLAASITGSLIWIIISAEDAPDLLASSPIALKRIRNAKLLAASIPVLVLVLPAVIYIACTDIKLALTLLLSLSCAMLCVGLIHLWLDKPSQRSQFKARAQGNLGANILENFSNLAWAGVTYLAGVGSWWATIPLGFALLMLGIARLFKPA